MTRWLARSVLGLIILVLAALPFAFDGTGSDIARANHDQTGDTIPDEHIDQISIDVGPPGAPELNDNGPAAVGDRSEPADGIPDAEGYDTPAPGDAAGTCGNGLDDDQADTDGDTTPDGPLDGVADDGCQVALTAQETCIEIIDNDVLDADEDTQVTGQDRAVIDITVGAQPGPGGGVPASRQLTAWQFDLNWDVDVLDVDLINNNFLIVANGGGSPFSPINTVPDTTSPMTASVSDAGPTDDGAGVLARLTIEGNAAGVANLTLAGLAMQDLSNFPITVDTLNPAVVAVSKDVDGSTVIGDAAGESFSCPAASDLEVVSATTAADATGTAGVAFNVDVSADVQNSGPEDTVDADVAFTLNMPSDCTTSSSNPQSLPATGLAEGALPTTIGPASFSVTCTSPSFHDFTGTATISSASVIDSNPTNNSATSTASTTAVSATADIGVGTVTVTGPATPALTNTAFDLDVDAALSNAGPDPGAADVAIDLVMPADCSTTSTDPQILTGFPVPLTGATASVTFSVMCSLSSNHDFTANVTLSAALHNTDSNAANDTGTGNGTVGVNATADLKVNSVTVTAPASTSVGGAFDVTADVLLHNNGPETPVNADVTTELFLPADCTSDEAVQVNPVDEVDLSMPISTDVTLNYTWSVTCTQPSTHTFTVDSEVFVGASVLHVLDPTPDNDFNSGEASSAVAASADLKVSSVVVTAPASASPNVAFNVTVDASLHNNGPFGPANTDTTVKFNVPSGCTATPTTQTVQDSSLVVSTATALAKQTFSVTCTTAGSKVFTADVTAAVDVLHVSDPTAGNATATGQSSVTSVGAGAQPPGGGSPLSRTGSMLLLVLVPLGLITIAGGLLTLRRYRRSSLP